MPTPMKIRVFGQGYGESLVLYVPGVGWGVVDSCLYKIDKRKINPALEYLLENQIPRLAFLVLTHPHKDHYLGLEQIINHYIGKIDRVCYYSGDGMREYREYLAKQAVSGEPGLRGLGIIFDMLKRAESSGATVIRLGQRTSIIRKDTYNGHTVEVLGLSPSARSIEKYRDILFKAIPVNDGDKITFVSDEEHNLLSASIWIEVDNIKVILGADLEAGSCDNTGWRGVLRDVDCPSLAANLVKVSHHGSENAIHIPVWEKFSESNKPVSVITPYDRAKEPLPREEALKVIKQYSSEVAVTSTTKFLKPKKVYPKDVVSNLRGVINWRCKQENNEYCFVDIDIANDGNYSIKLGAPAFMY